jgi:hypothetical protein
LVEIIWIEEARIVNHQQEIVGQRLENAQNAMKKAREHLIGLQHGTRSGWEAEKIIGEIEEIITCLIWASQQ